MTLQLKERLTTEKSSFESLRMSFDDGAETTMHIAKYRLDTVQPKIVAFEEKTKLLEWCGKKGVANAIGGSFFLRSQNQLLGDVFIEGQKQPSAEIPQPWANYRGSLSINRLGTLAIGARYDFEATPEGDLLQAGPLLLRRGKRVVYEGEDSEGFSEASYQFDSDITKGRYPRAAIGINDTHLFTAACDGRAPGENGMTLPEFAEALKEVGVDDALNLDGGSSATLIYDAEMRNNSWGGEGYEGVNFTDGRPIHSAIIFDTPQA